MNFVLTRETFNYIDLANSFLYVRVSTTTADGSALAADCELAPECNFLHSLWSQCDIYLNGTLVTQSSNNYPYRAYIENLLSFSTEAKDLQLSSILWYKNTAGFFNVRGAANLGYTRRKALAAQSMEIDMFGRMHLNLFSQNCYLLNDVEIRMRLICSKDVFCLHGKANQAISEVCLKEVSLFVRKIKNQICDYSSRQDLKSLQNRYNLILKMINLFATTCVYLHRLVNNFAILETVFLVSSLKTAAPI